jgi:hypothetical protein
MDGKRKYPKFLIGLDAHRPTWGVAMNFGTKNMARPDLLTAAND